MGGITSGQRRSLNRGTVEQYPAIDLRILRRAGLLRAGECTYITLHWRNQAPEALSVRILIDLSDTGDASIRLAIAIDGIEQRQQVALECVSPPFGGVRAYFKCPRKNVRCEQLFWADGAFASRKAHRLTYASQCEDKLSRARRKAHKLRRRLKGDMRYVRPRGLHRWDIASRLKEAEQEAKSLYVDRLRVITERSDPHWMPGSKR